MHKLTVNSLSHNFGDKEILADVSIDCNVGEVKGVLGRNGTGKSTLFKILFGSLRTASMHIHVDGQLLKSRYHLNKFVAYHPQEIMLPKLMSVQNLIPFFIKNVEQQNRIFYAAGICDIKSQLIMNLSLGQQRYLQFLLVINLPQPFILLDEPFAMVEPLYRDLIKEKIIEYKSFKGFLITDHYYLDVLDVSDKLSLIKDGKIIPIEKREELLKLKYLSDQSV